MNRQRLFAGLLALFAIVLVWSLYRPRDWFTWWLEALPALIGLVILVATYRRFPFTSLAYVLMTGHAIILLIGAHYTYAEVPAFNWLRDMFHLGRNHYDRLGHFAQGFVPAILAREILLRKSPLRQGKLLFAIVVMICLAISAAYELIEWRVSVATGTAAEAFLGTQGDPWDTQWDMTCAVIGAVTSLLAFGKLHDRLVASMEASR